MHLTFLLLSSSVWIGCSHRVQTTSQRSGGAILKGATANANDGVQDLQEEPLKALAKVLVGLGPAAAFGHPGVSALAGSSVVPIARRSSPRVPTIEALAQSFSRRAAIATTLAALSSCAGDPASAAGEEDIEVYFGCGCFWHVQHEFVEAERKILKRGDSQLTALAGYAGGKAGKKDGKVCYHNAMQVSDYGSLGHAEVVSLRIPPSSFGQFASEYFKLFDEKGNRPDQFGDRGLEYRNVVGVPGGKDSPLIKELIAASKAGGDKLDFAAGKGDDPDKRALAFIMDTKQFPAYQAEVYHQFHDGFNFDENYPDSYNKITNTLLKTRAVVDQGCPNGMLGIGIAGL